VFTTVTGVFVPVPLKVAPPSAQNLIRRLVTLVPAPT
jgi:hypothetical protein